MSNHHSEIQVPEYINKLFGKKTIPFNDYDMLEKIVRTSEFELAISIMENNLFDFEQKNGSENEKVIEAKENIKRLKSMNTWCHVLWENGANQLSIAFNAQSENLRLRYEVARLIEENEKLKKEIDFNK